MAAMARTAPRVPVVRRAREEVSSGSEAMGTGDEDVAGFHPIYGIGLGGRGVLKLCE